MQHQNGFTLLELLIVVSIVGIVAAATIPVFSNNVDEQLLDAAVIEVSAALRYARAESIRSGTIHGIQVSQNTQRVTVYKADLATTPVSQDYVLRHPLDKTFHDFYVDTGTTARGARISNTTDPFLFDTLGRRKNLLFDNAGTPLWIVNSSNDTYQLEDGVVQLTLGDFMRVVRVAPGTGRVTIE